MRITKELQLIDKLTLYLKTQHPKVKSTNLIFCQAIINNDFDVARYLIDFDDNRNCWKHGIFSKDQTNNIKYHNFLEWLSFNENNR